jgi:hypothetical protein
VAMSSSSSSHGVAKSRAVFSCMGSSVQEDEMEFCQSCQVL